MEPSDEDIQKLIGKKSQGTRLSEVNIESFVKYATQAEKIRCQLSKMEDRIGGEMLKEIYKKKLDDVETDHLTKAMIKSGETLEWPQEWENILVDKHSTGGVGDNVSLVLAPFLAACGLKVPMISGRALEHTGGTLDKLESIPGFTVEQNHKNMLQILTDVGCCIVSQSEHLVPADRILYRKRDETETVNELGLITGSIISKKVVESLHSLVLDVKFGEGAFCKTQDKAEELAIKMVKAGNRSNVKTKAVLTEMNSPLGKKVGNALEVAEAIQCLQGKGPQDLTILVKDLAVQLLASVKNTTTKKAYKLIDETWNDHTSDKSALFKFKGMMIAQGVDKDVANDLCDHNKDVFEILLSESKCKIQTTEIKAKNSGYVHSIKALKCGEVTKYLRSGKDKSDGNAVGLELFISVGDKITEGAPWVKVYHHGNFQEKTKSYIELSNAIIIDRDPIEIDIINKRAVCVLREETRIEKSMP